VIDEVVGQFLTLLLVAGGRVLFRRVPAEGAGSWPGWEIALAGFVFFRFFDIWKPYPIRRVERWAGGVGIMADDVLAGIYAGLVTFLVAEFGV
jgi:phosphatidylglycerophosphatase A